MRYDQLPVPAQTAPELSIVMPCYNEAAGIENLLREWDSFLKESIPSFEIIIVNDGSKDGTGRILDRLRKEMKSLRVVHQLNMGRDRAVRRGYEAAKGKYLVQVDSNGSYEPAEALCLWEQRFERHLVLGQRIRRVETLARQLGSYTLNRAARFLFKSHLQDPGTPFRLLRRDVIAPILASIPTTQSSMNIAMSVLMEKQYPGQLVEIPIPVRLRPHKTRRSLYSLLRFGIHSIAGLTKLRLAFPKAGLSDEELARLPA